MTVFHRLVIAALIIAGAIGAQGPALAQGTGLSSFRSDAELRAFLRSVVAEERRRNVDDHGSPFPLPPPPPPPPAPPAPAAPGAASAPAALGITNTQVAGVDEGGIVKQRGDILVILRRGRLFTVSLAGGGMRPIASIDAFPPGVDARGDWYDEMLIAGDRVVVVGYSYRRRGSQVNRFRLGADGSLAFEDSHQLRSADYYSSRNYATRLIGTRLILYTPLPIPLEGEVLDFLPAMRRWQPGEAGAAAGWRRIAGARTVYIPATLRDVTTAAIDVLHSVTSCDLTAPELDCSADVVLGNHSRTFFVSQHAVYLWIGNIWKEQKTGANSMLYRLPFDGGRPSAVRARGAPVDQFSFFPDAARSALQILVRAEGERRSDVEPGGDAWRCRPAHRADARIPRRRQRGPAGTLPSLAQARGNNWTLHNRFVGDHLLYSGGSTGEAGAVHVVFLADHSVAELPVAHGIDRIDAIGPDAIVVGSGRGALGFTTVDLAANGARVGDSFMLPNAREGETRSHAFFFRPDPDSRDGASGVLGLPVARFVQEGGALRNSAAMLFLNRREDRLTEAGQLSAASYEGAVEDGCQASCADWYGNARPLFIGNRVFALLGYELVEGAARGARIAETARIDFAPRAPARPAQ